MNEFPIVILHRLNSANDIIKYNKRQCSMHQPPLDFDAMFHFIRTLPEDDARKLLGAYMEATDSDSVLGWLDVETI